MKRKTIILGLSIALVIALALFFIRLFVIEKYQPSRFYFSNNSDFKKLNLSNPYSFKLQMKSKPQIEKMIEKMETVESSSKLGSDDYFTKPIMKQLYDKSILQIQDIKTQNISRLLDSVKYSFQAPQKIPNLIHYVWISNNKAPFPIPESTILRLQQQIDQLPSEFQIFLWIFSVSDPTPAISFQNLHPRIHYVSITDYDALKYGIDLFDSYFFNKRYRQCADLVAYNILYQYGGIYLELDCILNVNIQDFLWLDYLFAQEQSNISTKILGCSPKNKIYHQYLLILEDLFRYKNIQQNLRIPKHIVTWSSALGLSACVFKYLDSELFLCIADFTTDLTSYWKRGSLGQPELSVKPISDKEYLFTRKTFPSVKTYTDNRHQNYHKLRWGIDLYKYFAEKDGIDPSIIDFNRKKIIRQSYDTLYNPKPSDGSIPRILHRIWLTHDRECSTEQLETTRSTYELLYPHWTFIFWTNSPERIPNTIEYFRQHCPHIQVRKIDYSNKIYQSFLKNSMFARAKDIVAMYILYEHGGLFVDMGVNITRDLTAVLSNYQLAFYFIESALCKDLDICVQDLTSRIDICILACSSKEPLFKRWLDTIDTGAYKKYDRKYFNTNFKQHALTAVEYLYYLINAYCSEYKILFLIENGYFTRFHLNSWVNHSIFTSEVDLWNF